MRTFTIFRKELKDTMRDRRTILMMIVMPLVLVPLLITVVTKIQQSQIEKAEERTLSIAFVGKEFAPELYVLCEENEQFILFPDIPEDSLLAMTKRGELDGAIIVAHDFPEKLSESGQGSIRIIFKSSDAFDITRRQITNTVEEYEQQIVDERILKLNLDRDLFNAIRVEELDISSIQEKIGKLAGGWLPYLFIIFGFMGAMYPGLDLGAGEKERGTLETLLSSPANRLEIVLGKFLVVMLAGIVTALVAMFGLYIGIQRFQEIPSEVMATIMNMFGPKMVIMILSLILPVSAFFSATILSISIYARSFKEAQSIVTPLNVAIILPAIIGTIPGIELNATTALVPILNVSLATKDLLAGTINPLYLIEVYLSLFLIAGLSIWGCVWWFNREEVLFRS